MLPHLIRGGWRFLKDREMRVWDTWISKWFMRSVCWPHHTFNLSAHSTHHTEQVLFLFISSVTDLFSWFRFTTIQTNVVNSTLAIRINVTQTNYLRVCGSNMKDSMNHVKFFLDFNVTTDSATYVPTPRIIPWHTRKYAGDECTLLTDVPPGQHVLSLVCMARCYFTHLISYEWMNYINSINSIPLHSLF